MKGLSLVTLRDGWRIIIRAFGYTEFEEITRYSPSLFFLASLLTTTILSPSSCCSGQTPSQRSVYAHGMYSGEASPMGAGESPAHGLDVFGDEDGASDWFSTVPRGPRRASNTTQSSAAVLETSPKKGRMGSYGPMPPATAPTSGMQFFFAQDFGDSTALVEGEHRQSYISPFTQEVNKEKLTEVVTLEDLMHGNGSGMSRAFEALQPKRQGPTPPADRAAIERQNQARWNRMQTGVDTLIQKSSDMRSGHHFTNVQQKIFGMREATMKPQHSVVVASLKRPAVQIKPRRTLSDRMTQGALGRGMHRHVRERIIHIKQLLMDSGDEAFDAIEGASTARTTSPSCDGSIYRNIVDATRSKEEISRMRSQKLAEWEEHRVVVLSRRKQGAQQRRLDVQRAIDKREQKSIAPRQARLWHCIIAATARAAVFASVIASRWDPFDEERRKFALFHPPHTADQMNEFERAGALLKKNMLMYRIRKRIERKAKAVKAIAGALQVMCNRHKTKLALRHVTRRVRVMQRAVKSWLMCRSLRAKLWEQQWIKTESLLIRMHKEKTDPAAKLSRRRSMKKLKGDKGEKPLTESVSFTTNASITSCDSFSLGSPRRTRIESWYPKFAHVSSFKHVAPELRDERITKLFIKLRDATRAKMEGFIKQRRQRAKLDMSFAAQMEYEKRRPRIPLLIDTDEMMEMIHSAMEEQAFNEQMASPKNSTRIFITSVDGEETPKHARRSSLKAGSGRRRRSLTSS